MSAKTAADSKACVTTKTAFPLDDATKAKVAVMAGTFVKVPPSASWPVAFKLAPLKPDRPVAAFDFDSTLAPCRGSGPAAADTMPVVAMFARTHNVVIFSNRSRPKMAPLTDYVAGLANAAGDSKELSVSYFASMDHDAFRKPHVGMWVLYATLMGLPAVPPGSFFCGDAAGRHAGVIGCGYNRAYPMKNDFSASDLNFARNVGLRFYTPEIIFPIALGVSIPCLPWPAKVADCDPNSGYSEADLLALDPEAKHNTTLAATAEAVAVLKRAGGKSVCFITVGSPGSGKSAFAARLVRDAGFTLVARETATRAPVSEATVNKQIELMMRAPRARVIVDGTHGSAAKRKEVAAIAARAAPDAVVAVVHLTTPKSLCMHLNAARCALTGAAEVPDIAIHTYWKNFEPPKEPNVVTAPFVLSPNAPDAVTKLRY